jgi:hypothetical protein
MVVSHTRSSAPHPQRSASAFLPQAHGPYTYTLLFLLRLFHSPRAAPLFLSPTIGDRRRLDTTDRRRPLTGELLLGALLLTPAPHCLSMPMPSSSPRSPMLATRDPCGDCGSPPPPYAGCLPIPWSLVGDEHPPGSFGCAFLPLPAARNRAPQP